MDRRTYFKQMALATGGVLIAPQLLVSCKDTSSNYTSKYVLEPFKTLDEIKQHIGASKGHLFKEVERLILKKDANSIFSFIQNSIATIPPTATSITSNAYETRWGNNGMLRCGKGTLREKSDLLYFMLTQSGFNVSYHRANFEMTEDKVKRVFKRKWDDLNTLETPAHLIEKWNQNLAQTQEEKIGKEVDQNLSKHKNLKDKLLQNLPENYFENVPTSDWLSIDGLEAPVVRLTHQGVQKDLNFVEDKSFEEFNVLAPNLFELSLDSASKSINKVRLIVNTTYSNSINMPLEIARGEWDFETIVGKQIALQFITPIPQEQLLDTPLQKIQQFVPVLSLKDPSRSQEEQDKQTFKGVGFDLFGNTFSENGDGAIVMNGLVLNEVETNDTSVITNLKVQLIEAQYPTIRLRCAPLDKNNNPVLGLSGGAFFITDQEQQQIPIITQNTSTPKVLVLYDGTSSMPYPYAALEVPQEVLKTIETGLDNRFGSSRIESKSYLLDFMETLQNLDMGNYDHIICIGDGESFESVDPNALKTVMGSVGISYHYVKNYDSNQTSKFVERCFNAAGYSFYHLDTIENSISEISDTILNEGIYPYEMVYEAPLEKDNLIHKVTVGIANNTTVAPVNKQYIVNRERAYEEHAFPCGISITLQWNNGSTYESVQKHIAGFDVVTDNTVTAKHKEAIRSFVLGTHRFFFEADKATLPVLLDDLLASKLSVAPFFEENKETIEATMEQVNTFEVLPAAGLSVFAPLAQSGDHCITFENNFQTCFYSEYVDFDKNQSIRKVDIWPTSDVVTLAPSKKEAFDATLQATSLLAISESTLFSESTLSSLNGKSIATYQEGSIDFRAYPNWYPLASKAYQNYILYDSSHTSLAHWQIAKKTGALLGILPDGSGGGIEQTIALNLKLTDKYAAAYNKAAAPLMSDPLAFGTVTMYGQFLARLYGLVCVAVVSTDAAFLPAKSRKAIKKLAYGVIKSFAFAKFSKLKNFEKILDKLFDPGWPEINSKN